MWKAVTFSDSYGGAVTDSLEDVQQCTKNLAVAATACLHTRSQRLENAINKIHEAQSRQQDGKPPGAEPVRVSQSLPNRTNSLKIAGHAPECICASVETRRLAQGSSVEIDPKDAPALRENIFQAFYSLLRMHPDLDKWSGFPHYDMKGESDASDPSKLFDHVRLKP
jgi:hypothetical protein